MVPYAWSASTVVDGAITAAKLADNAVSSTKIVDGSITPADLDRSYVNRAGDTMQDSLWFPTDRASGIGWAGVSAGIGRATANGNFSQDAQKW